MFPAIRFPSLAHESNTPHVRKRMAIKGGVVHSFIESFRFSHYSLVIEEYQEHKGKFIYAKTIETLESGLNQRDFDSIEKEWKKKIKNYG